MSRYSDYLALLRGPAPAPASTEDVVRVYAATDGTLHTLQSDGTDAEVGSGGGVGGLLGPVRVSYDTPGFFNPPDNGVPTVAIPNGTIFRVFALVVEDFNGADAGDALSLSAGPLPSGSPGPTMAYYTQNGLTASGSVQHEPIPDVTGYYPISAFGKALVDVSVFAAYFPNTGVLISGSIDVYVQTI